MPFYTTPISQLDTADLQELLGENAVENVRLEFTQKDEAKNETLKKLSSFANSFGGHLVVGGRADSRTGRLQELPGVEKISNYKQRIVQWCTEGANPPLTVEVSEAIAAPGVSDKFCYVVYAAESDIAPHFLNSRNGFWVRTDEFSFKPVLANDRELRQLLNRRQIVHEHRDGLLARAGERFQTYLDQKHGDRGGQRTKVGPFLELSIAPRFPSRQLCALSDFKDRFVRCSVAWKGGAFTSSRGELIYQHESAITLDPIFATSFFEMTVWGTLFYAAEIASAEVQQVVINTHKFIGLILLFMRHAWGLLESCGYSGDLTLNCRIDRLSKIPWLDEVAGCVPGSRLDDSVAFSGEHHHARAPRGAKWPRNGRASFSFLLR